MAKDPRVTRIEDLPGPKSKEELEEMKMHLTRNTARRSSIRAMSSQSPNL